MIQKINFEIFNKLTDHLIVVMAPMNLSAEKLPHYQDSHFEASSRILINPGTQNYYRDCVQEVCDAISNALLETGATTLVFCGSSMGAFGALYFGSLFKETKYVVAYAPSIRLDHPGTISKQVIQLDYLIDEDTKSTKLLNWIQNTKAVLHLFYPCFDDKDGIKISESKILHKISSTNTYYLTCEHNIHEEIGLPEVVSELINTGRIPREKFEPFFASSYEIEISLKTYYLYLCDFSDIAAIKDFSLMPIEETKNWRYFYWKARTQARAGLYWESLSNFIASIACNSNPNSEQLLCIANVLKEINLRDGAIGFYREALKLNPQNSNVSDEIARLSEH